MDTVGGDSRNGDVRGSERLDQTTVSMVDRAVVGRLDA